MKFIEYLNYIKECPGMFIANGTNLRDLELQIHGYETALKKHNIANDVNSFNSGFRDYLAANFDWSTSCGWADAITRNSQSPSESLIIFFELANRYLSSAYGISNALSSFNEKN